MPETLLPQVPEHLPFFITPPGETDVLMNVMIAVVVGIVVLIGVFYLKLHALPERMAHKGSKVQFEIVAVLALLALLTHNHIFWVAALLLAMVQIPDVTGTLASMSRSLDRMAGSDASPRERLEPLQSLPADASPQQPTPIVVATADKANENPGHFAADREVAR